MADDDYKKRAKKLGAARNEKSNITLKEGDNCLRVLPTPAGETSPEVVMEYLVHYEVGPYKVPCRCGHEPGALDEGECWLCDVKAKELRKKKKVARAEKLAPSNCVVVMASEVKEDDDGSFTFGKPKPWRPSGKVGSALLTQILASKKRDYVHPKKGYNINISRTGTGFKETRYGPIEPDDEPSSVPKAVIKELKPFDQVIYTYNERSQKAAYAGKEYTPKDGSSEASSSSSEEASVEPESGLEDVLSSSEEKPKSKKKTKDSSEEVKKKPAKKKKKSSEEASSEEDKSSSEEEEEAASSSEEVNMSSSEEDKSSSEEKPKKRKKK